MSKTSMASVVSLASYCRGTRAQRARLHECGIVTMSDLVDAVGSGVEASKTVSNPPPHMGRSVWKRHLLGFLGFRCKHLRLDFQRLASDGVVILGGTFPNEWIRIPSLGDVFRNLSPDAVNSLNGGMDEEAALAEAVRLSNALPCTEEEAAPLELCCPITCVLLCDPVRTMHGNTYERSAIELWLKDHDTDPMTGAKLMAKVVYEDAEMVSKLEKHAQESTRRGSI